MTTNVTLHDEGWHAILEAKYSRIISEMSQMYCIPHEKAVFQDSLFSIFILVCLHISCGCSLFFLLRFPVLCIGIPCTHVF